MAQTRKLWARCLGADGSDGLAISDEAIATDSRWREREKGECGVWRLTSETEATAQLLSLVAHA